MNPTYLEGPFPLQHYFDTSIAPSIEELIPADQFPNLRPHTEQELLDLDQHTLEQILGYWRSEEARLSDWITALNTQMMFLDTLLSLGFMELSRYQHFRAYDSPVYHQLFQTYPTTFLQCSQCYFGRRTSKDKKSPRTCQAWYDHSAITERTANSSCIFHDHSISSLKACYYVVLAKHDDAQIHRHTIHAYISYLENLLASYNPSE